MSKKPEQKYIRIYIAGKLNDLAVQYIKNLHHLIKWGEKVRKLGVCVLIPGLDILQGLIEGDLEYDDYFNNNLGWLLVSNAVFVTPNWEQSKGVKKEIEIAKREKIPVFFEFEELKKWVENVKKSL